MAKKHVFRSNKIAYKVVVGTRLTAMRRLKLSRLSEAQGHRCAYCCIETYQGKRPRHFSNDQEASLEHLIPQSEDEQTNKDNNLIMACSNCNTLRARIDPMRFYRRIRKEEIVPKKPPKRLTAYQVVKEVLKDKKRWELCWIIAAMWPEEAANIVKEWRPPRLRDRHPSSKKIFKLAQQVTADSRRMAA